MRFRVLPLVAATALAAGSAFAGSASDAARFAYVALGDSFSSGEGVRPYLRDTIDPATGTRVSNRCDRSTRAYATYVQPPTLAASAYTLASGSGAPGADNRFGSDQNVRSADGVTWSFWACSGARTRHVLPRDNGGGAQGGAWDGRPQLESAALAEASLVTLTIGGNDAGYVDTLVQCGLFRCNTAAFRQERSARIDGLKPQLEQLYAAVAAKAPKARILVLGYPQPFPASKAEQACSQLRAFTGEQDMIRALGVRLNATIAGAVAAAAATGANVRFVPVAARFAGHEVCGRKGAWMNGIVVSGLGIDPGSFHPNARGQRDGLAAAVNAALR